MNQINPYRHGGEALAFDGFGNRSRNLNGVDDYISIPDINENTTNLSVALWLKTTDLNWTTSHLAHWKNTGNNRAWNIGPSQISNTNGKKLMVYLSADGDGLNPVKRYYGTTDVSDGTWHHVAFTWGNGTLKLFVDGSEETTTKEVNHAMTTIVNSDGLITVGCTFANGIPSNFGSGGRADIRIYNSTLTASEISDIYNGTNITTNLAGHWLTDADDVEDKAGSNNGTDYGTKYSYDNPSPPVEFGRASRSFDGSSNYVDCGDILDTVWDGVGKKFTFATWIKTDALDDGIMMSKLAGTSNGRTWYVRVRTTGELGVLLYENGTSSSNRFGRETSTSGSISAGVWTHCAFVYDQTAGAGNFLKMYIDGLESTTLVDYLSSGSFTGILIDNATPVQISGFADGSAAPFGGKLADCRIYDTDLTGLQISDLYAGTDVQANLVGHWLTDNDDVEDKAGTNDGTNFGSTYSYEAPLPANKLIDTYASTCGAYSLRELTTDWAGLAVVNVRRASDGSTSDFTSSEITDGTLSSFCGTQGGFVNTVYDQSGNSFDLIQPTDGFQPKIYVGATQSVNTLNGKPCLDFSSSAYLYNSNSFDYEGGVSWYCVLRNNQSALNTQRIWCDDITGTQGYLSFTAITHSINDGTGYTTYSATGQITNQQQLRSYNLDESQGSYVYGNDGSSTSGTLGGWAGSIEISGTSANIGVMGAGNGTQTLTGLWQELIVYPNDQLHNKQNIERNINEFYSIY